MKIKKKIKQIIRWLGFDIMRFTPDNNALARRVQIIKLYKIDTVLDIGANSGQYAQQIKELGFKGEIISFEPTKAAFDKLKIASKKDGKWKVFNFALGDNNESKKINIANNSYSSSFLNMLPRHLQSAPESYYVDSETITVKTLDSIWDNLEQNNSNIYMKMDVQGFEQQVLLGALESFKYIPIIQMEMSLVSLYEDEPLFQEMMLIMKNYGYTLITLESSGFYDETSGQLLQVDGIFCRSSLLD